MGFPIGMDENLNLHFVCKNAVNVTFQQSEIFQFGYICYMKVLYNFIILVFVCLELYCVNRTLL